jgi:hypothetical protein
LGDILAFFLGKNNTPKIFIHRKVVIEYACILGGDIDRLSECRPSFPINRMTMGSCMNIWPGLVDGRV